MKRKGFSKRINIPLSKISLAAAIVSAVAGALFATKILADVNKNIANLKEAARPANVKLIKITTPDCQDCFDVEAAVSDFKKQNINLEEEKIYTLDSPEAGGLIKQFAIQRVPTYIVLGEVSKSNLEGFIKNNGQLKDNNFIFTKVTPVFIDTESRQEIGNVVATVLVDPACSKCLDPKLTLDSFKKAGIKIADQKEVIWNSLEGQKIIRQYKITKLPTFIFSSEIDFYDNVKSGWANIGTVESDKTYVARNLFLPYRDLEKNQILGLVDLIYLTDFSCSGCYNATEVQKPVLTRGYGVVLRSERTVDISTKEGRNLISQYKISKIPTVILSPEADVYTNLKNVWKNVGTVEVDGWYVFREMQQLGGVVYKDLATNQIVGKAQPSASPEGGQQ